MILSPLGCFLDDAINTLSEHYPDVIVCEYAIMPNHVHLLLQITDVLKCTNTGKELDFLD